MLRFAIGLVENIYAAPASEFQALPRSIELCAYIRCRAIVDGDGKPNDR